MSALTGRVIAVLPGIAPSRAVVGRTAPVAARVGGQPSVSAAMGGQAPVFSSVGGELNLDVDAVHWRGAWVPGTDYHLHDLVTHADRLWVATTPTASTAFEATAWTEIGAIHTAAGTLQAADPQVLSDLVTRRYFEAHTGGAGGTIAYRHTQSTADEVWVIKHGLTFNPNVTAVDSTGREVIGEVDYPDADTVVLTFSASLGGEAYCS